jgi:hypothetical protein
MNFKIRILFLTISCLLSSCWSKQKETKNSPDFGFFKTSEAGQACVSSNVSQWELTGKFLHNFLSCASNRSVDGEETLSGIQTLLTKLDEAKFQKVLDFVLKVDPNGTTHEERYPYLLAATTLLDRGLTDGKAQGLNLSGERLGSLQEFLITLDATKSKEILSTWSRSGHLAEVLNEFGAFVDQLEENSLESATHELLSGSVMKPEFLYVSRRLFQENILFTNLSDLLKSRDAKTLTAAEQQTLLAPYREALTASDSQALLNITADAAATTTPLKEFADQHKQYSPEELKGLSSVVLSYWKSYQALTETERLSLDARFADAMNSILGQQAHSAKWILALLRDANSLEAKDLGRTTYALDQLLLEGSNISLEAIRAKAGASKLTYQLQLLLTKGGKVSACPYFDKPALDGDADFKEFTAVLNKLSSPQADCGNRIPLLVAVESITGIAVGDSCGENQVCLEERIPFAGSQELWSKGDADPATTKKLVLDSIAQLRKHLAVDPYALYNLQLSRDRLDDKVLAAVQKKVEASTDWSLDGLALLDESVSKEFSDSLQNDFLEKLLTYRIETLASQSHQFLDLAPEQPAEIDTTVEARTSRIFAGLYTDGPIESLVASRLDLSRFSFSEDQQDLKAYLESHPSVWSRIVFKAKEADGIFRSPSNGAQSGETAVNFSGAGTSIRNYLGFDANPGATLKPILGSALTPRMLQPMQATRMFSDDDTGHFAWSNWGQHYGTGPLTVKDVPAELSQKLQDWYLMTFIPTVSDDNYWPEQKASASFQSSSSISSEYFDVTPYSSEEARLLTSYYLKQYQKLSPTLPTDVSYGKSAAPTTDLSAFADPIRGFLNSSYLVRDDYEAQYSVYAKYFANALRSSSKMSELKNAILPDYATFTAQSTAWNFEELAQVNEVARLTGDSASPFALLSTLDLLTFSKPQTKFLPQSLVGFGGKLCRSKVKDSVDATVWVESVSPCPLDFQAATEEEAYNKFRDYVSSLAIQSLCPLLTSDDYGPRSTWSQRLGLTLDNQTLCKSTPSVLEDYRFPTWHSSRVLNDIFTMGKKATLKPGLVQIPSGLRFYKLKHKGLTNERLTMEWLQQGKGVWSERNAADQRRREFFAGGFWVGSPNLLNSYLNLMSQHLDPFSWRTILIAYAERGANGEQRDTLRDLIRLFSSEQKLAAEKGETAFSFALTMIDKIGGNPEYREFIANFVTNLNSSEAYDFYSNELPLATIQLFPSEENPFDWNDKGLRLSKYLAQHTTLRSWQIMSESFSPSEVDRFIAQTHEALRAIPELRDRTGLLSKLSTEVVSLATLYLPGEKTHLTEQFENLAMTWSRVSLGQEFRIRFATMLTKLSLPLQGINGEDTLSGESMMESFISAAVVQGPSLLHKIQMAGEFTEPLFWRNWADSFLASIESQDDGAVAMANFLAQKRFDFADGKIWMELLHPTDLQNKAILALEAVDSVPENIWRAAIVEGSDLSVRLTKALSYLRSHLIWKIDPDHNAYRIALDQLFELSQDENLRDKQLELVTLWLDGEVQAIDQSGIKK